MFPVKYCKRVVAMLVLLVFAGQALALTIPPCRMAGGQSLAEPMAGGDTSVHAQHGHDHSKAAAVSSIEPEASDCCAEGHSGCSMSSCVSIAMMSAFQPVALPVISAQPPMHHPDPVQSQYPTSLYRPPISR